MKQRILIVGGAGQIARKLLPLLLKRTDAEVVLYGRHISERMKNPDEARVTLIDGTFGDRKALERAMEGVDTVYLNAMENGEDTKAVVDAMKASGTVRLIAAAMAGMENEVAEKLSDWTNHHLPSSYIEGEREAYQVVTASDLDYTLLRLTWLYDDAEDREYELVPSGEIFRDAEVSREAVAEAIFHIWQHRDDEKYIRKSFGTGKPGTHYDKPSFY